jgi:hypothetical protein
MSIKTIRGTANLLNTEASEKWASAPATEGGIQTQETLHRGEDGTWVLHVLRCNNPPVAGRYLIDDIYYLWRADHAAMWLQRNRIELPAELQAIADEMTRCNRRTHRGRIMDG